MNYSWNDHMSRNSNVNWCNKWVSSLAWEWDEHLSKSNGQLYLPFLQPIDFQWFFWQLSNEKGAGGLLMKYKRFFSSSAQRYISRRPFHHTKKPQQQIDIMENNKIKRQLLQLKQLIWCPRIKRMYSRCFFVGKLFGFSKLCFCKLGIWTDAQSW